MANKRQHLGVAKSAASLYNHFRTIGMISTGVPFHVHNRGGSYYVTTALANSFQIFDLQTLNLVFAGTARCLNLSGPIFNERVIAVGEFDGRTVIATKSCIYFCHRGSVSGTVPVEGILFASITEGGIVLLADGAICTISSAHTPRPIYYTLEKEIIGVQHVHVLGKTLRRCILGTSTGQLWLFESEPKVAWTHLMTFDAPVRDVRPTEIDDLSLVCLSDGSIHLFTLETKAALLSIVDQEKLTCSALSSDGSPFLVTGSASGKLKVWNLEHRRVDSVTQGHVDAVAHIFALPNQPVFITNSVDNSLKVWALEGCELRLLKSREGHYKPIEKMLFLDGFDDQIVTAGQDGEVRLFSLSKDSRSCEISQGSVIKFAEKYEKSVEELRLPVVNDLDIFETRSIKWANMITCHRGLNTAYAWKLENKTIMKTKYQATDASEILSVAISPCGNFVALGTASGLVDVFNIQSGTLRSSFRVFPHVGIVGIGYSLTGTHVFAVASSGGISKINLARKSFSRVQVENSQSARFARPVREMNMIAVAYSDFDLVLVDIDLERIVRRFCGHTNQITDVCISKDQRHAVTASLDGTVKTWDMESSTCIDTLSLASVPKSITLSPNMEFLAIAWSDSPTVAIYTKSSILFARDDRLSIPYDVRVDNAPESMLRLSGMDRAKWLSFINYDAYRDNNKPVIINDKPIKIPFFLDPLLSSAVDAASKPARDASLPMHVMGSIHTLGGEALASFLGGSSWPAMHLELSTIPQEHLLECLQRIFKALEDNISRASCIDMQMLVLNYVLKVHGDFIAANRDAFKDGLSELRALFSSTWEPFSSQLDRVICLASFCRGNGV